MARKENDEIVIDKCELEKKIKENKDQVIIFEENVKFYLIPESIFEDGNKRYFVDIKNKKEHYIGILNKTFKKDLFGYILFNQKDEYLGQILNEKKNGFGIYKFNSDEKNERCIYIGNFVNNNINGKGVYICILNNENKLNKYNCYIGLFENGKFKNGKIYSVDNDFEKLEFQEDEEKEGNLNINEKEVINVERKNNINIYTKGIMKEKILIEGCVISINDKETNENQFLYKLNSALQYDFEYFDDENKINKLIMEFKSLNFDKYRNTIQELYNKIEEMINKMKNDFNYAKELNIKENFENNFVDNFNLLLK